MVRVAVLGCGVLGSKMIADLTYHGHEVRAYDTNPEELDKLVVRLDLDSSALRKDGLLDQEKLTSYVCRTLQLREAVGEVEFVFEAVVEDLATKRQLIEQVSHLCPASAVIGSSSMHLDINAIFEKATGRDRCLGVRFLYPVLDVTEVEIQKAEHTSSECVESVRHFLESMGKIPFPRSGNLPIVLNRAQREYRRLSRTRSQPQTVRRTPSLPVSNDMHRNSVQFGGASGTMENLPRLREKDCVICMDAERDCVVHPCHHLSMCINCAMQLLEQNNECPICREEISTIFRIYYA